MRAHAVLFLVFSGCGSIFGIPSEGSVGCPSPCMVTVSGKTILARSTTGLPLGGVTVKLVSVDPPQSVTTGADGSYSFSGLPPDTPLRFDVSVMQVNPDPQGLDTQILAGNTTTMDAVIDLPIVEYAWLAKVAFQCGIFPTLDAALYDPGTMNVNSYFKVRSTVVGEVLNADLSPATAFDRADVAVVLRSPASMVDYTNFQGNPDSMTAMGVTVCFLEPDNGLGEFKGVNEDTATTGRFVMFRVRNDTGTGTGTGAVNIPSFPAGPLNVSAGTIGFARMVVGVGDSLPARKRGFARDVYHWFADKQCSALCHKPGGLGFMKAPVRLGPDGTMYPADWSGLPSDVFDRLTKPVATGCEQGVDPDTRARVCLAAPKNSLLYLNPTGKGTHEGTNDLTDDDPMIVNIVGWITDGALP
jgi:hypothetical protein